MADRNRALINKLALIKDGRIMLCYQLYQQVWQEQSRKLLPHSKETRWA